MRRKCGRVEIGAGADINVDFCPLLAYNVSNYERVYP